MTRRGGCITKGNRGPPPKEGGTVARRREGRGRREEEGGRRGKGGGRGRRGFGKAEAYGETNETK